MWRPYLDLFPSPDAAALPGSLHVWPGAEGPPGVDGEPIRRDIVVWLPPGAEHDDPSTPRPSTPLPSVWLHDGQNAFDPHTSFAGHWRAAEALADLAARGRAVAGIAVGNAKEQRIHEYSPYADARHGGGGADAFLDHLADTIRPRVLERFPIDPSPARTAVVGSSLGGLLALWTLIRRPDLAHHCAALSPSVWYADDRLADELAGPLADWRAPDGARVYLDTGAWERGRPSSWWQRLLGHHHGSWRYVRSVRRVSRRLHGRVDHLELVVDSDGTHDEASWARRFPAALDFLCREGSSSHRGPSGDGP